MKKRILLTVIVLVLTVALLVGCTNAPSESSKDPLVTNWASEDMLIDFTTGFPMRTAGDSTGKLTTGELQVDLAANWIADKMIGFGYAAANKGLVKFNYENPFKDNRIEETNNVIFRKDNATSDKLVVVGAHYDNAAGIARSDNKLIGGDGVYNNAVGVVALLQLANQLSAVELPFDVEFVFFGAGEMGHKGSENYLSQLGDASKNILLMINYDRVVGGDNLYMYTDEVAWEHESLFYKVAAENKFNATALPANKRPALYSIIEGSSMMYFNEFMLSDNMSFLSKGIPSISFTSMNASSRANAGYVEVDGKKNIDYTQADTLAEMKERLGGSEKGRANISSGIDTVVSITLKALTLDNFVAAMESSLAAKPNYEGIANYKTMQIVGWSIVGGIIVLLLILYFVMKSKVAKHDVIIESPRGYINMTKGIITLNVENPQGDVPVDPFASGSNGRDPFGMDDADEKSIKTDDKPKTEKDIFGNY